MKVSMNLRCDRCGAKVATTLDKAPTLGWNTVLLRPFLSADDVPDRLLGDICDGCSSEVAAAMGSPEYSFTIKVGGK